MELGKLSPQPPLVAAFCLCLFFIITHFMLAPADPQGLVSVPRQTSVPQSTPQTSFLAFSNGKMVGEQLAKQETKKAQKIIKTEKSNESKEEAHVKKEESNLKKEQNLLEEEKSAFSSGNTNKIAKLEQKLDKLLKAEVRDASIASKAAAEAHKHEQELGSLFDTWAKSMKHPGKKWGGKHEKAVNDQHKWGKKFAALEERRSRAEKGQANFVEEYKAFQNGKPQML